MEQTWFGISHKVLYSIIAVILLLWGLSGLQEIAKTPYVGYFTSPDNVVTTVEDDSPAAAAGLQVGDQLTKLDGIAIENSSALAERPRAVVGSVGSVTVQRGSAEQTLNFRYSEQPTANMLLNQGAGIVVGLVSLLLGLFVYLRNPTLRSSMLCLLLLTFASLFLPGPYLATATARGWLSALFNVIVGCLLALLLLYCLQFPRAKRVLRERPWLSSVIVLIALLPGVIFAYRDIVRPDTTAGISTLLSLLGGLVSGGIFLCSLWAVVHSYRRGDANVRRDWGLNWMLLGVVIGLVPVVLSILTFLLFPRAGQMWWQRLLGLAFLAIPICFTLALMKREPVRHAVGEKVHA